ncbi:MAG: hypothetical protein ACI92G_002463 [Candidatus Pelagisphaera sp.]|jgi:hypothetical protein
MQDLVCHMVGFPIPGNRIGLFRFHGCPGQATLSFEILHQTKFPFTY